MAKSAKKKGCKRKKTNEGDTPVMSAVEGAANFNINFELGRCKGWRVEIRSIDVSLAFYFGKSHLAVVFGRYYEEVSRFSD